MQVVIGLPYGERELNVVKTGRSNCEICPAAQDLCSKLGNCAITQIRKAFRKITGDTPFVAKSWRPERL